MSPDKQPRRGPWTADDLAAIERAVAEGRVERIDNGYWPYRQLVSWATSQRLWLAG